MLWFPEHYLGLQAIPASLATGATAPFNIPPGHGFSCPTPVSPAALKAGVLRCQPLTTKSRHSKLFGARGSPSWTVSGKIYSGMGWKYCDGTRPLAMTKVLPVAGLIISV